MFYGENSPVDNVLGQGLVESILKPLPRPITLQGNWVIGYYHILYKMYYSVLTVCTKTPRFPYILLPTQEVRVYFIAMTVYWHAPARNCKCSKYARQFYHVCGHIMFSIYSTTARLYWSTLISAYGAGPPKVIGLTKGYGGEQYIFA